MFSKNRTVAIFIALAVVAIASVACGTSDDPVVAESSDSAVESTAIPASVADSTPAPEANGGLDPECVELVLGRSATGFADITDAERTRVFSECSTGGGGGRGLAAGGRGAGFDRECVTAAIGVAEADFTQLTPEQRTSVLEACGDPDFAGGGGFGGGRVPGQDGAAGRPGLGAGGGAAGLLENPCVQEALGQSATDLTQLTPEERQRIFTECASELGAIGGGGGFGGRQDGQRPQGVPSD